MSTQTRTPPHASNLCVNCWWRAPVPGWAMCTPCLFRPQYWRIPCTCTPVTAGHRNTDEENAHG